MIKFDYIHHACFTIGNKDTKIIFDPFLDGNPGGITPADVKVSYILVSHAHADHLGSAVEIALQNNATIISTAEVAGLVAEKGAQAHAMHIGGTYDFPFGKVRVTPAFHGSGVPGGHACGFIVHFFGKTIYFAGDTSLFSDMKLLGEIENIDYAILPIGDNYTMGPDDAIEAVKLLQPRRVLPAHHSTWPLIAQDAAAWGRRVAAETSAQPVILKPGESCRLK